MLKKVTGKIINKIFRPEKTWQDIEYFDDRWKKRIEVMSGYLSTDDKSVIDLGCGKMWLKEFLNKGIQYTGVDYVERGDGMIVCDFNTAAFPDINADVIFISGCLEYIIDYTKFIGETCSRSSKVIISYCSLEDNPDLKIRRNLGWKNNLNKLDIVKLFNNNNFYLTEYSYEIENNNIFVFNKK